jgi:hypothetical protein
MLIVKPYSSEYHQSWDALVRASRNGFFLFERGYLEYHADRFIDCSLCIFEENALLAVFPANRHDAEVISHGGLTFGGIICDHRLKGSKTIEVMQAILRQYRESGVESVTYKAIPTIFHTYPVQEDLFALSVFGARLVRRDLSTAVPLKTRLEYSKGKREGLRKAAKAGITVRQTVAYATFHEILQHVLSERHGIQPVHSPAELEKLGKAFPDQIKLYGAFLDDTMIAGSWVFLHPRVLHTQYMAGTDQGRQLGGLDVIIDHLIKTAPPHIEYLSFGISSYDGGTKLNPGLLAQKEMFGGRGIVHDIYEVSTSARLPEGILHGTA